jgi:tetratricopeptide (TPR) repeat protein
MFVSLLSFFSQLYAENVIKIDADKQFAFAEFNFKNSQYAVAISEYKRFIYFFPNDKRIDQAMLRTGMCQLNIKDYTDAIDTFSNIINIASDRPKAITDIQAQAYFMKSRCYAILNDTINAVATLGDLIQRSENTDVIDKANYHIGWLYIENRSWEAAKRFFEKISNENYDKYRLDVLTNELDKAEAIKEKSPGLAGMLSIIPGAGFLYCKRPYDALTSFLFNTALILAAYESFDNGNSALGGVISFVEAGFFAGNIYGSITSVHKYNKNASLDFINHLRETAFQISTTRNHGGIVVSLNYRF